MSLKSSGGPLSDSSLSPKQILSTVVPQSARLFALSKEEMRLALSPWSLASLCCHGPLSQLSSRIMSRTNSQSTGVTWDAPATSVLPCYCFETRSFVLLIFSLLVPDLLFPPGFMTKGGQEPPLSGPGGIHSVFWSLHSFSLSTVKSAWVVFALVTSPWLKASCWKDHRMCSDTWSMHLKIQCCFQSPWENKTNLIKGQYAIKYIVILCYG